MQEPLEDYLDTFDAHRASFGELLRLTSDLTRLRAVALDVLSDPALAVAARYLTGPPISAADLEVLADGKLSPARLRSDPETASRVVETLLLGLDTQRFPWMAEGRLPTDGERSSATLASAALLAARRVMTDRANESKGAQEEEVKRRLKRAGLREVPTQRIDTLDEAPKRGQFCGEALFAGRKADVVVRLWDGRAMPIECKVSNSSTNSVKRLNNDAVVKAVQWLREFGSRQTVPAAVLAGVFKTHNLEQAQDRGLTIFWAHALSDLTRFISATKP